MKMKLPDAAVRTELDVQFARLGAAIGHPVRLRILSLLVHADRTVEWLANECRQSIANVSAHLRVLREAHLVSATRDGRHMWYRLTSPRVVQLCALTRAVAAETVPEVRELAATYYADPEGLDVMSADELRVGVAAGRVMLVDLRPPEEYDAGHLPAAHSLPFAALEAQLASLPKDVPIAAYCRGAWCVMERAGIDRIRVSGRKVIRVADGIGAWRAAGRALAMTDA